MNTKISIEIELIAFDSVMESESFVFMHARVQSIARREIFSTFLDFRFLNPPPPPHDFFVHVILLFLVISFRGFFLSFSCNITLNKKKPINIY